jgi:hypothetical protein
MQTLDLSRKIDDASLEGVLLGLVFTSKQRFSGKQRPLSAELGKENENEKGYGELECFDEAIRKVEEQRLMEGMIEFAQGKLSFLLYRVD